MHSGPSSARTALAEPAQGRGPFGVPRMHAPSVMAAYSVLPKVLNPSKPKFEAKKRRHKGAFFLNTEVLNS